MSAHTILMAGVFFGAGGMAILQSPRLWLGYLCAGLGLIFVLVM